MNAVEIEEAVSQLASQPFERDDFPFDFLRAFGMTETTLKRLRSGNSSVSDVKGAVLQRNNIHLAVCDKGKCIEILGALRDSPKTKSHKVKFLLATDGEHLEAEYLEGGDPLSCPFPDLANHFGFFLPLAGITTIRAIKDNPVDIKATARLNRLFSELLKDNPDWGTGDMRSEMNRFMARIIFCFFAEDTNIFLPHLFTKTVDQMSKTDGSNTHDIVFELFRAMDTKLEDRAKSSLRSWADCFPYVNGKLFAGVLDVPRFSKVSRSYLLRAGDLDWKDINPDIFGSMIQAVANEEERGELGLHYTSVPNILKVLGPLFLDGLYESFEKARNSKPALARLRDRLARLRVLDPACGSGNFLVIAYIKLRELERAILLRLGAEDGDGFALKSIIPLTNFYGIEIKGFAAEIARLSLLLAEFQCNARLISQQAACSMMLPLNNTGKITNGNALQLDWLEICPPVKAEEGEDGFETFICGNPPYVGSTWQSEEQKNDLKAVFAHRAKSWKSLDYVAGWMMKAADYSSATGGTQSAFVTTNSICQGQQVPILWPLVFAADSEIAFAHTSFKWANLAARNAGVTVIVVGLARTGARPEKTLFGPAENGETGKRLVGNINAYLVASRNVELEKASKPISDVPEMTFGNKPVDGGHLFVSSKERDRISSTIPESRKYIRKFLGSEEFIKGLSRYCLWIEEDDRIEALSNEWIARKTDSVQKMRLESRKEATAEAAAKPYRFAEARHQKSQSTIIIPRVSSENRDYLPVGLVEGGTIIGDRNFALYDAPLWSMALIASRLHWVWIGTVCVRLEMRFSYSNTLGWNTFPVPRLLEEDKAALTRCAENILLARERHFPKTIADLYKPDSMPGDLKRAHDDNDETLERIYIGRRFRNDSERLEKLFDLYTKMTGAEKTAPRKAAQKGNEK